MTVPEWRIHDCMHEAGNDNVRVSILSTLAGRSARRPKLWERLIFRLSTVWETPTGRRIPGGWAQTEPTGRPSPGDVCSALPRRLIQMKDDPDSQPFGTTTRMNDRFQSCATLPWRQIRTSLYDASRGLPATYLESKVKYTLNLYSASS